MKYHCVVVGLVIASPAIWMASVRASVAPYRYIVTDIGGLGPYTTPFAISENGFVTGVSHLDGVERAFLYDGTMHGLGTLGGTYSTGEDINSSGLVVGHSATERGNSRAFLHDGVMHDLGTLGGTYSSGLGISENGFVAGLSHIDGDKVHAFMWDGTMHDLGTLGGERSFGFDVNNSGLTVGSSTIGNQNQIHAFLYDGVMHDLGTFGGPSSMAFAVNEAGHVTGFADLEEGGRHAFLWDGVMRDLGTLGANYSQGMGINNHGHVVGWSFREDNSEDAFLYTHETGMISLDTLIDPFLGWDLFHALDINDIGQIVARGMREGTPRAVLLTPVPEPMTAWLVIASLATAPTLLRRRSR